MKSVGLSIVLSICTGICTAQNPGSDCFSAISVESHFCREYNNTGIAGKNWGACMPDESDNSMWFLFTAEEEAVTITVNSQTGSNPMTNSTISLQETPNDCSSRMRVLACDGRTDGISTITYRSLSVGSTYFIVVDGQGRNTGNFQLCVNSFSPRTIYIRGQISSKVQTFKYLKDRLITIKTDKGVLISSVVIDETGMFQFERLPYQGGYILSVDDPGNGISLSDISITGEIFTDAGGLDLERETKLYFKDFSTHLHLISASLKGSYRFEYLPQDNPVKLEKQ